LFLHIVVQGLLFPDHTELGTLEAGSKLEGVHIPVVHHIGLASLVKENHQNQHTHFFSFK
jgi:hypothetical protein